MITQTATIRINMDREDDALEMISRMVTGVEEEEPGVLAYVAHRLEEDPSLVIFFEVYRDDQALKEHDKTLHMEEMKTRFRELFQPPVKVQRMERIAGFTR